MAIEKLNPATTAGKSAAERKRVPMSVPVQRLEAPEIPGFHLHWFNGTPERLQRAVDGGYEFVDEREMKINPVSIGGDTTRSGNTDMGSRVSVVSGTEIGKDGQPMRLILMKIRLEWYEEDQKLVEEKNDRVANTLKGGLMGAEKDVAGDTQQRYLDKARTKIPDLFTKKLPKVAA